MRGDLPETKPHFHELKRGVMSKCLRNFIKGVMLEKRIEHGVKEAQKGEVPKPPIKIEGEVEAS